MGLIKTALNRLKNRKAATTPRKGLKTTGAIKHTSAGPQQKKKKKGGLGAHLARMRSSVKGNVVAKSFNKRLSG